MQDLDAVLGCPIWMIPEDTYDKLDSLSNQELNILCDANFYCLNWFRELINTFSKGHFFSNDSHSPKITEKKRMLNF